MHLLVDILLIVLPVFLVVGLGFSLKGSGLVDAEFLFRLNRLIYYVALPALLFYKIATADFSSSFNPRLLAGMVLSTVAVFAVSYLYTVLRRYPMTARGAFTQAAFRGNVFYIGLAIVFNAYGSEGFAIAGILIGFLVPLMNGLAVLALLLPQRRRDIRFGKTFWLAQFILNPLIIASIAGIAWSFFKVPLPLVFDRTLAILTGMSLPLALLSIGASFSFAKLRGEIHKVVMACSIKIVWMPILASIILVMLGVSGMELGIGVVLAASPTATASYIMAQQLHSDAELSGSIIMLSTLLSLITYSVALFMLRSFAW